MKIQKCRKHRRIPPRADGASFVIPETKMRAEPDLPTTGSTVSLNMSHEPLGVFTIRIAAHRGLVYRDLGAACVRERLEFCADDRQQRFGRAPIDRDTARSAVTGR